MRTIFRLIREVIAQARLQRLLAELDERTLRDIGFEVEANRRRDPVRMPHPGMY